MSIIFVSDIHLCINKPKIIEKFLNFLHKKAINANALYILGDLFEIWIGDDYLNSMHLKIAKELKKLKKKRIPCYFIHGNHDFLLSKNFANTCGMTILKEPQILETLGYKILLSHGDNLCIDDIKYQKFKNKINRIWLQQLFLSLPLSIRIYIFKKIKNVITKNKLNKSQCLIDINQHAAINLLLKHKAEILIHGHTHQISTIHKLIINKSKIFYRINLNSWCNYGSIIELNKFGIFIKNF